MAVVTLSDPGKAKLTDPVEIVQGVLAFIVVGSVSWDAIISQPIPSEVMLLATAVVGFYFGKTVQSATATLKTKNNG